MLTCGCALVKPKAKEQTVIIHVSIKLLNFLQGVNFSGATIVGVWSHYEKESLLPGFLVGALNLVQLMILFGLYTEPTNLIEFPNPEVGSNELGYHVRYAAPAHDHTT